MIPNITFHTDRLTLRTPIEDDFDAVAEFMASPRARFVGGPVSDPFHQWRGFMAIFGHWAMRGYGFFTVLHQGQTVGRVGVVYHIMWDEPELGWHLYEGFEGYGYATEAAAAARDWAMAERGLGPLISYIHPENRESVRVAERLGATLEGNTTLLNHPAQLWRHIGDPA